MSAIVQPSPWIISRNQDLTWFIGGSLVAGLFLAVCASYGYAPPRLIVLWAFALDGPHVMSTATRILFARGERNRIGRLWLAVIPIALLTIAAIALTGYKVLAIVILTWGHFHIFKQHMGFVFIFKRKARETSDYKLDKYFTLVSMFVPYTYYLIAYLTGSRTLLPVFAFGAFGFSVYFAWHQIKLRQVNSAKLLLLTAFILLHWLAFFWAARDPQARMLPLIIVTNIGHSFQYLRLMWFHNTNRYGAESGLIGFISRKWLYFFALAFLLALPTRFIPANGTLLAIVPYTLVMFHYIVDAKIWRVRGDKELAAALRL